MGLQSCVGEVPGEEWPWPAHSNLTSFRCSPPGDSTLLTSHAPTCTPRGSTTNAQSLCPCTGTMPGPASPPCMAVCFLISICSVNPIDLCFFFSFVFFFSPSVCIFLQRSLCGLFHSIDFVLCFKVVLWLLFLTLVPILCFPLLFLGSIVL